MYTLAIFIETNFALFKLVVTGWGFTSRASQVTTVGEGIGGREVGRRRRRGQGIVDIHKNIKVR